MTRKADIELALWRSGLLRKSIANGALQDACAVAARHVVRLERNALAACNGVPKGWDAAGREPIMGLDDSDTARMDKENTAAQAALQSTLRPFLTPGCVFKFYSDPRGANVRIRNKQNTRDAFL
jgi:hypothetical protein